MPLNIDDGTVIGEHTLSVDSTSNKLIYDSNEVLDKSNTGNTAGKVPIIGTNLGSTNENIIVTDTNGKLKPAGVTITNLRTAYKIRTSAPSSTADGDIWIG